jgi:hypothetical protein
MQTRYKTNESGKASPPTTSENKAVQLKTDTSPYQYLEKIDIPQDGPPMVEGKSIQFDFTKWECTNLGSFEEEQQRWIKAWMDREAIKRRLVQDKEPPVDLKRAYYNFLHLRKEILKNEPNIKAAWEKIKQCHPALAALGANGPDTLKIIQTCLMKKQS